MELKIKKRVLILTEWYLPGRKAGGPVKSIESLVWAMGEYFDFYILTTDSDLGEKLPYKEIMVNQWISQSDGSKVFYMRTKELNIDYIQSSIQSIQYDFLYLNSLYSKWFSIIPLRLKMKNKIPGKIILAPRGMLSRGALRIKTLKKKSFIFFSRCTGLHREVRWHATYPEELKEIKENFGEKSDVIIAKNFSKPVLVVNSVISKKPGELRLFYLSRISKVKNLHIAIKSLTSLNYNEGNIIFDVYGSAEDSQYLQDCKNLTKNLNKNITVNFLGSIENEKVGSLASEYHFLFLPTSNENFGHSIFESLQSGCPVIIGNNTPWKNLEHFGCGWDLDPQPENLRDCLIQALKMDESEHSKMRKSAKKFVSLNFDIESVKREMRELFS